MTVDRSTAFSPRSRPAIGVDLGGTKIEAIVLDADGQSLWRERVATPAGDYHATLQAVHALITRAETELRLTGCSIGIGTPGTTTVAGLIKNANSTCLNGQPVQHDLERLIGRSIRLANDANCFALSEATDGAASGAAVVFAAILGTGVGAGIVVDGRMLTGPNGLAGEWGHNPLPWADAGELPGPRCYCGRSGCIETWLSGPALSRDHVAHTGEQLDAREVAARAESPDRSIATACDASLKRYEHRLARGLAHVINLLDPDVIVLGGGVSQIDRLLVNVPRLWGEFVFSAGAAETVRTRLVRPLHGDSSGVRGAAFIGADRN
jgi:fructokinase